MGVNFLVHPTMHYQYVDKIGSDVISDIMGQQV